MELTLEPHKESALALSRCQHRTPAGRRCRFNVSDPSSSYCPSHSGFYLEDPAAADLAPALLGDCTEINTAQDMKRVLGKIFLLLAQNRISIKKAATLTYIIQQLLRTLPAIEHELEPKGQDAWPELGDLPRPPNTWRVPQTHPYTSANTLGSDISTSGQPLPVGQS
jgi:hypothetical protein